MERYQQSDPFKFLIYAEQADADLGPVGYTRRAARFLRRAGGSWSSGPDVRARNSS